MLLWYYVEMKCLFFRVLYVINKIVFNDRLGYGGGYINFSDFGIIIWRICFYVIGVSLKWGSEIMLERMFLNFRFL